MQNIKIRKAKIEDLENIQNLNNELFELEIRFYDDTLVKDWPLSKEGKEYFIDLIKNEYVYVAEEENVIIGYLAGSIVDNSYIKNKYAEINNMCITYKKRGCDIGSSLLNSFKDDMKKQNITELRVTASYRNKNAKDFYEKHGFVSFEKTFKRSL